MVNKQRGPQRLVQDIFATGDDEIQCDEAHSLIAACLDAALSDEQSQQQHPALWRHFRFCSDCTEEYRILMEVAAAERAGQLDRIVHVPPLPDGGKPPLWNRAKETIRASWPGLTPRLATLGATDSPGPQVVRQDGGMNSDGSVAWKVTFIIDSADPTKCQAEIEVSVFDRWDLSGIDVFLTWNSEQRCGQTDERGRVQLTDIPIEVMEQTTVRIQPPQLPMNMNGPQ
jgi:hypothetical protein